MIFVMAVVILTEMVEAQKLIIDETIVIGDGIMIEIPVIDVETRGMILILVVIDLVIEIVNIFVTVMIVIIMIEMVIHFVIVMTVIVLANVIVIVMILVIGTKVIAIPIRIIVIVMAMNVIRIAHLLLNLTLTVIVDRQTTVLVLLVTLMNVLLFLHHHVHFPTSIPKFISILLQVFKQVLCLMCLCRHFPNHSSIPNFFSKLCRPLAW
mmetsp:Transcript_28466/g.34731  ORF Transcript_28466/g.34731 Transcript_28466/m.34731 type:complete len:209 (+) Transcript_28466:1294-1920(+)